MYCMSSSARWRGVKLIEKVVCKSIFILKFYQDRLLIKIMGLAIITQLYLAALVMYVSQKVLQK